jgi:hypothetical protein
VGQDGHTSVPDGNDQIRLNLIRLRQTASLHQPGKNVADDILALLGIMQQSVGGLPKPGMIPAEQLFYRCLPLIHLFSTFMTAERGQTYRQTYLFNIFLPFWI